MAGPRKAQPQRRAQRPDHRPLENRLGHDALGGCACSPLQLCGILHQRRIPGTVRQRGTHRLGVRRAALRQQGRQPLQVPLSR